MSFLLFVYVCTINIFRIAAQKKIAIEMCMHLFDMMPLTPGVPPNNCYVHVITEEKFFVPFLVAMEMVIVIDEWDLFIIINVKWKFTIYRGFVLPW